MSARQKWELSNSHDWTGYAHAFSQRRRLHIPDILKRSHAEAAYKVLAETTTWNTVFNAGDRVVDLTPDLRQTLSSGQSVELDRKIDEAAGGGQFQFKFDNCRLSDHGEPFQDETSPLASFVDLFNSPRFLQAMRRLVGRPDIAFADVQITRYMPGHFLHIHNDVDPHKKRIAAYVLNLTTEWSPEWGGILHFVDVDGHIAEGYVPKFNALNVLEVGSPHFVSYVAPFARTPRLSVTGWLRGR